MNCQFKSGKPEEMVMFKNQNIELLMTSKFFAKPETVCTITGVNKQLIKRLNITLEALTSGHRINVKKLHETAEMHE